MCFKLVKGSWLFNDVLHATTTMGLKLKLYINNSRVLDNLMEDDLGVYNKIEKCCIEHEKEICWVITSSSFFLNKI
jgi:hypothetical protein